MAGTSLNRWNEGFFRPLERSVLGWLVARMPPWVTPDVLTGVGVVGAIITFAGYALSGSRPAFLWLATLGLAINWFGDSLDGTLARFRHIERPRYGYYLDNTIDCIAALLLALGIGLSGYVRCDLCFFALSAYMMMSVLTFVRANVTGIFQISYAAVGPTEVRVAFAVLNALIILVPPTPFQLAGVTVMYTDLLSLSWSLMTLTAFMVCMAKQIRQLAVEEPALQSGPSLREIAKLAVASPRTLSDEIGGLGRQVEPI
jgi:archaetidylinositol phosphate synthase